MLGPVQLNRVLRRYCRLAVAVATVLGVVAAFATVRAASITGHEHHGAGHHDAVVLCVALGGCVLAVAGATVALPRLAARPMWAIAQPLMPTRPFVAAAGLFLARAGPPPLLQVFRL